MVTCEQLRGVKKVWYLGATVQQQQQSETNFSWVTLSAQHIFDQKTCGLSFRWGGKRKLGIKKDSSY